MPARDIAPQTPRVRSVGSPSSNQQKQRSTRLPSHINPSAVKRGPAGGQRRANVALARGASTTSLPMSNRNARVRCQLTWRMTCIFARHSSSATSKSTFRCRRESARGHTRGTCTGLAGGVHAPGAWAEMPANLGSSYLIRQESCVTVLPRRRCFLDFLRFSSSTPCLSTRVRRNPAASAVACSMPVSTPWPSGGALGRSTTNHGPSRLGDGPSIHSLVNSTSLRTG